MTTEQVRDASTSAQYEATVKLPKAARDKLEQRRESKRK